MYYNSSTAADAQATTSVWNSNFAAVWHLKETATSTASYVKDSTSNANNGSSTGSEYPVPISTGKIDGAQSFDGNNDYVQRTASTDFSFETSTPFSLAAWINRTAVDTWDPIFGKFSSDSLYTGYAFQVVDSYLGFDLI